MLVISSNNVYKHRASNLLFIWSWPVAFVLIRLKTCKTICGAYCVKVKRVCELFKGFVVTKCLNLSFVFVHSVWRHCYRYNWIFLDLCTRLVFTKCEGLSWISEFQIRYCSKLLMIGMLFSNCWIYSLLSCVPEDSC